MADLTWVTAQAADGPKLVRWLIKNCPELNYETDPHGMRRLHGWKEEGARAGVWAIDSILTRHFKHLMDLPDDVWVAGYANNSSVANFKKRGGRPRMPMPPQSRCPCGDLIPYEQPSGRRHSPAEYARKKFCSPLCQRQHAAALMRERKVAA